MHAIEQIPLFNGLTSIELEELAAHLEPRAAASGEVLIDEGSAPGHPLSVLLGGTVEVSKVGLQGRRHVICTLSAPSVFGEIEVLSRRPAIASVVASSDVQLAVLRRGIFDELCDSNRSCILKLVMNLARTLSHRLAATDEQLATFFEAAAPNEKASLGGLRSTLFDWGHAHNDA